MKRNLKTLVASIALSAGLFAGTAKADQTIPLVGHLNGANSSVFRSDLKLINPLSTPVSGTIYLTERSQNTPDANLPFTIQPNQALVLTDVYDKVEPGKSGAARVDIVMGTDPSTGLQYPDLPGDNSTYTLVPDGSELSVSPPMFNTQNGFYANETLVGILGKATERNNFIDVTGPQGATIEYTLLPSDGTAPITVTQSYGPNSVYQFGAPDLFGKTPPNSIVKATITSGSARVIVTPVNNINNQGRIVDFTPMPTGPSVADIAILYVNQWLPHNDSAFYLSNNEARAMILGNRGTRSYASDLAAILVKSSANNNGTTAAQLETYLLNQADGVLSNGDLFHGYDPFLWTIGITGQPEVALYDEPHGGAVPFPLSQQDAQAVYNIVDDFLPRYVAAHGDEYGGTVAGQANMKHDPKWNTQDPN